MNKVILRGYLRDVCFSHFQGDNEYEKANIICPRVGGQEEDIISIRYKKHKNTHKEGDFVEILGNLRSYSQKSEGKNSVQIYVFTHFDPPDEINEYNASIDGRICKIDTELHYNNLKTPIIHFILANNIYTHNGKKINSYIPCTAYGELAESLLNCKINDIIQVDGNLRSHCYKKTIDDEIEYRIAHELIVKDFRIMENLQ